MPKLVILTPDAEGFRDCIARDLPELEIATPEPTDEQAARAALRDADCMLAWKFPPGLLDDAPRLRWVMSFGAGVDHLVGGAVPRDVTITRVLDVFSPAMAEYVLGYCYAATLQVRTFLEQQQRAEWRQVFPQVLGGRTAVVIGLGRIGSEVCRLLRAAGLRVLGVSRSGSPNPHAERTLRVADLDRALPEADFLVVVAPMTPDTRGMIGARQLALLPTGAWLINIARGPLVVERDLIEALQTRALAGAVLDVFDQEPLPRDHPFWSMDNVFVTPHISGPDDTPAVAAQFVENYRRFTAGQPLTGQVDPDRGY